MSRLPPRCSLPHARLDDEDGRRRPVKDVVAPGRFLLIPSEDGHAWYEAARQHDPRCAWQRHRQIASDGAIVVRPDRFIAWRSPAAASDPRGRPHRRAQPDPWAQTVCSARVGRFLIGTGAAQQR